MPVRLSETAPLVEAAPGAPQSRRFRARLIQADVQGSSGFYPVETLRRDGPTAFPAGTHVYCDHPSMSEAADRPERSVKDLAGRLVTDAVFEGDGLYAEVEVFPHYAPLIEGAYGAIGMSIRALGTCEPSQDENIPGPIVTALTEGISVDFVTKAGAGGKVLELIESARANADGALWEAKYDAAQLRAMLAKGQAMKNAKGEPSYPIADEEDLRNAIRAVGRGGADHDRIRAHIIKRAKALGKSDLIPDGWTKSGARKESADAPDVPDRQELREAGATIGARLEARIHTSFTIMADDLYCDGRLTRDERITLSSAFGDALATFVARLEADAPQLYKRGPWSFPPDEDGEETPMSEAAASESAASEAAAKPPSTSDDDPEAKPAAGDGGADAPGDSGGDAKATTAKTAPGTTPAPEEKKEGAMPEITEEQLKKLEEATNAVAQLQEATATIKEQGEKIATLEARLAEADKRDQARDNTERARTLCEKALAASGLPEQAHPRVLREATASLPTGGDGRLDEAAFGEAVKAAIQSEKTYLAELDEARGYGIPRGLTSDPTPTGDNDGDGDLDAALAESLQDIGMTADEAKIAAAGR